MCRQRWSFAGAGQASGGGFIGRAASDRRRCARVRHHCSHSSSPVHVHRAQSNSADSRCASRPAPASRFHRTSARATDVRPAQRARESSSADFQPEPPVSGPDTPIRPRACQLSSCARSTLAGTPAGCLGVTAQPAQSKNRANRKCRCMAVAGHQLSFCRRCFSSSLSGYRSLAFAHTSRASALRFSASSTSPRCRSTSGSLMRRLARSR
jgi:hypothetical protein